MTPLNNAKRSAHEITVVFEAVIVAWAVCLIHVLRCKCSLS